MVFNGTGITGDFWRGTIAGCINALNDTVIYPVINAKCIFIDDFPSPQYENDSEVLKEEYNRTVGEFYRDIWWPDMQKIAKQTGDIYTGLFVATYNDIVNPDDFYYEQNSMEQYYGNSLLKNGYELGAHGYNHQSLAERGFPAGHASNHDYPFHHSSRSCDLSGRKFQGVFQNIQNRFQRSFHAGHVPADHQGP